LDLAWIMQTPDEELEAQLSGSPLRRPRAVGLKRNAVVVLENIGTSAAIREIERGLNHPHPVVVTQTRQALGRLSR
jgi:epoxyqueuosine reductase QueG